MARPKTYSKGIRREIMLALGNTAVLPVSSIEHMDGNKEMIRRKLDIMAKEGVLGKYKKIYYQSAPMKEREYYQELPIGYMEYAERYIQPTKERIWHGPVVVDKLVKDADTQLIAKKIGLRTYLEEKEPLSEKVIQIKHGESCYYNNREIKGTKKDTHLKYDGSRINGCIVTENEMYPVYNLGKGTIKWYKATEERMKRLLYEISDKFYREKKEPKADIVLYQDADKISCIINKGTTQTKVYEYLQVDFLYDSMYAIPKTPEGMKLLKIITTSGWYERMLSDFIPYEEQARHINVSVACDGVSVDSKGENVYTLLYCIPDLNKLSLFANRARMENKKDRYKVYCFTDQAPIIAKELGEYAKIYTIDINKYYADYMKAYQKELEQRE